MEKMQMDSGKLESNEILNDEKILESEAGISTSVWSKIKENPKLRKALFSTVIALGLIGAASTSEAQSKNSTPKNNTELFSEGQQKSPFTAEFKTDDKYYRAIDCGKCVEINTAKTIANLNAKVKIMKQMASAKKDSTTIEQANGTTTSIRYEATLKNTIIADEKLFRDKDGSYIYWVAMEMEK